MNPASETTSFNMYRESRVSVFSQSIYSASSASSSSITSSFSSDERFYSDDDEESESEVEESSDIEGVFANEDNNAVGWVINNEAYCFDVTKFSEKLVEATFIEANKQLRHKDKLVTVFDIIGPIINEIINLTFTTNLTFNDNPTLWSSEDSKSSNDMTMSVGTDWPKISEFNIKLGLEKLEDYVSTWERLHEWLFCVEFLGFESEDCSNVFVYEVEWSKPTKMYPIPQATASVYFALEVFKMVPYNYDRSIEVTYVFESSNVIHAPGRIDFQEKWLQDIIDAKIKFFKTVTFGVPKGYCQTDENSGKSVED